MDKEMLEYRIRETAEEVFSRSGGPGGQNVNKLNTRVTLRIELNRLELSEIQLARLHRILVNRINAEGMLVLQCSETRSQLRNREIALERAVHLIGSALQQEKKRRPTRPTAASRERRLKKKQNRGRQKQQRNWQQDE
ncbi:alternative ribosome rescue aminoacyl-tRNA hydrolase ArfB [Spirochaeta dissipatitropha]